MVKTGILRKRLFNGLKFELVKNVVGREIRGCELSSNLRTAKTWSEGKYEIARTAEISAVLKCGRKKNKRLGGRLKFEPS